MAVNLMYKEIRYSDDGNMALLSSAVPYIVTEAEDESAARAQIIASIPRVRDGLRLDRVTLNQRLTGDRWQFDAEYIRPSLASYDDDTDDDDPQISFSCRPKTITRTTAIGRVSVTMAPGVTSLPEITGKLGINTPDSSKDLEASERRCYSRL